MIKNYILDTNVLIHYPGCIYTFEDNNIIIPIICLEELDNLKKKEGILGYPNEAKNCLLKKTSNKKKAPKKLNIKKSRLFPQKVFSISIERPESLR